MVKFNCTLHSKLLLSCILYLIISITKSTAKCVSQSSDQNKMINERQLRDRESDISDSTTYRDEDEGYSNLEYIDDSLKESAAESSYGEYSSSGSAYGDYSAYTPKGSSSSNNNNDDPYTTSSSSSYSNSGYGYDSYDEYESSSSSSFSNGSHGWGASSSSFKPSFKMPEVKISLIPAIFLILLITVIGMLITAHQIEHHREGTFANCCRVSLTTVSCVYKVIYNLYHCRLGEIPQVVFASEFEDDDELTDEELQRMKLRPGIERALDVEHRKALRKVGIEMNKIRVKDGTKKDSNGGGLANG